MGIDLGAGTSHQVLVVNGTRIDDGHWHDIRLERVARQVLVTIDGRTMARRVVAGDKTRLDSKGSLYLGELFGVLIIIFSSNLVHDLV